jgi:hypothetical protein
MQPNARGSLTEQALWTVGWWLGPTCVSNLQWLFVLLRGQAVEVSPVKQHGRAKRKKQCGSDTAARLACR